MKIIDLLNKIANGEEVPKFWWNGCIHEVEKEYGTNKISIFDTYCKRYKKIELENLNDEIEIIEEDKNIEKIEKGDCSPDFFENNTYYLAKYFDDIRDKINEIIDKLNKEEK